MALLKTHGWLGPQTGRLPAALRAGNTDAAVRQGASREEIAEALGVAVAINTGTALVSSIRVLDAHAQITNA